MCRMLRLMVLIWEIVVMAMVITIIMPVIVLRMVVTMVTVPLLLVVVVVDEVHVGAVTIEFTAITVEKAIVMIMIKIGL